MEDLRRTWYPRISLGMAYLSGIITFIGAYIYCISEYGFLLGFGLGWFPSALLAGLVGVLVMVLWLPLILVIAYFLLKP